MAAGFGLWRRDGTDRDARGPSVQVGTRSRRRNQRSVLRSRSLLLLPPPSRLQLAAWPPDPPTAQPRQPLRHMEADVPIATAIPKVRINSTSPPSPPSAKLLGQRFGLSSSISCSTTTTCASLRLLMIACYFLLVPGLSLGWFLSRSRD